MNQGFALTDYWIIALASLLFNIRPISLILDALWKWIKQSIKGLFYKTDENNENIPFWDLKGGRRKCPRYIPRKYYLCLMKKLELSKSQGDPIAIIFWCDGKLYTKWKDRRKSI